MPNTIPPNWQKKSLGEICSILNGLWTGKKEPFCEARVLRNTNFTKDCKLDFSDIACLQVEQRQFASRELKKGDLLLEKSGGGPKQPVGRIVLFNKDEKGFSFSNFTSVLRVKDKESMTPYFLHWFLYFCYLSGVTIPMQKHTTGIRNLQMDEYKNIVIPIPPLSEQKRIVEKLDKIFADIDKAKENTNKNLENTKEIFCSELQKVFENKNLNWVKYKLSKITTKIGSGATPLGGRNSYITTGISLIRSMNVYDNQFVYEELAHITKEQAKKLDNVTIQANDLLLNITGASVARCCVVPEDILPARVNQHVSILRPISELVNANFLCYLLISKPYKQKLLKDGEEGGSTRQALTKEGLKCFEVSIPKDIQSQEDIVNQLNALRAKTQELEQIYTKKLADLDELKQSVLQQAFSGKL